MPRGRRPKPKDNKPFIQILFGDFEVKFD